MNKLYILDAANEVIVASNTYNAYFAKSNNTNNY